MMYTTEPFEVGIINIKTWKSDSSLYILPKGNSLSQLLGQFYIERICTDTHTHTHTHTHTSIYLQKEKINLYWISKPYL